MYKYNLIDPQEIINTSDFTFIKSFLHTTNRSQIGWHYITDIAWIYSQVKNWPKNIKILDAGGGGGAVQFLLAELGFDVTNIDLCLSEPPYAYKIRYNTSFQRLKYVKKTSYIDYIQDSRKRYSNIINFFRTMVKKTLPYKLWSVSNYTRMHEQWRQKYDLSKQKIGKLRWITGNLCHLPEIEEKTYDAVVSLSALEHISFDKLTLALNEVKRILISNARWAVTTSATEKAETWFHEPSQGYCFSIKDLIRFFDTASEDSTDPAVILEKYRKCDYLKRNLSKFYFKSDKNGMPLGEWSPKYIPVGIYR
jgi:ubiquinone/menaquinone biosynthesis C-methylase UbiE